MSDSERDRAMRLLRTFEEAPRHLDFDGELVPYVDGTLDAASLEIVESHLEDCRTCREEAEDLRRLAVRRQPRRRARVVAMAAAIAVLATAAALVVVSRQEPPRLVARAALQRAVPAEWQRLADQTLRDGRLPAAPVLASLQARDGVLRGGATARARVAPDGVVVETAQPRFTWPAAPQASYRVFVYAGDHPIAESPPLDRAEWTPAQPLPRDRTYQWQVETALGAKRSIAPAPEPARFRIISDGELAELDRARAAGDPLVLAALYARAGLMDPAVAELRKLAGASDPRMRRLLASYEASPNSTNPAQ